MKKITFKSILFCRPIGGVCSSYGIWLNDVGGKNVMAPLAFFKRPKWITEKEYKEIMERVIDSIHNSPRT